MMPRLPPELIALVQAEAEQDATPAQRRKLRSTFELVNKEWNSLVDHFTFVVILEVSDVARLRSQPSGRRLLRAKARSVAVELSGLNQTDDTQALWNLFALVPQAELIMLNLPGGQVRLETGTTAGSRLVAALGRLQKVRHFAVDKPANAAGGAISISLPAIQKLARSWPLLESFIVLHSTLGGASPETAQLATFASCPNLRSLTVHQSVNWSSIDSLVTDLPPTLTALALVPAEKSARSWRSPPVVDKLSALAPQLESFEFVEARVHATPVPRGFLDGLAPRLESARRLTLQPHAMSNLAASLGPLPHLAELTLAAELQATRPARLEVLEVAALVRQSNSLELLRIQEAIRVGWSKGSQDILGRVMKNKGVELGGALGRRPVGSRLAHSGRPEEGESSAQRQHLRSTFELVNKEWNGLVNHFTQVIVLKLSDASRLWDPRRHPNGSELLGAKVRSVEVELGEVKDRKQTSLLVSLFNRVSKVKEVVIRISSGGVHLVEDSKNGAELVNALAQLANLRRFEIDKHSTGDSWAITTDLETIQMLAHRWPKLETFVLRHSNLNGAPPEVANLPTFDSYPNLTTLCIHDRVKWSAIASLVSGLPPSLAYLGLAPTEKSTHSWRTQAVVDNFAAVAATLKTFHFEESRVQASPSPRGFLDDFAAKLSSVRLMTVQPHAVSNLAAQLGPLPHLAELALGRRPKTAQPVRLEVFEVTALVRQSGSLRELSIDDSWRAGWSSGQRELLQRVTRNKGVQLVWTAT